MLLSCGARRERPVDLSSRTRKASRSEGRAYSSRRKPAVSDGRLDRLLTAPSDEYEQRAARDAERDARHSCDKQASSPAGDGRVKTISTAPTDVGGWDHLRGSRLSGTRPAYPRRYRYGPRSPEPGRSQRPRQRRPRRADRIAARRADRPGPIGHFSGWPKGHEVLPERMIRHEVPERRWCTSVVVDTQDGDVCAVVPVDRSDFGEPHRRASARGHRLRHENLARLGVRDGVPAVR